nr:hypothetical protein GCM10020092_057850 [Actinoplanes digitatis]
MPAELPVPADTIASVVVETANARLADRYNLVDTPGLDSLTGLDDPAMAALAEADALLYVMPHPGERDREALEALRGTSGRAGMSAANVLGVLSRVDTLGDGGDDPWPRARRIAARYARDLRGLVADVVPVIGLLAETAAGDTFTEADARRLRRLAALDPDDLEDFLYAHARSPSGEDSADRARLLRLLGVHGLREAVAHVRSGVVRSDELLRRLAQSSGVAELVGYVEENFIRSADRLRAASAVTILERATWLGGDGDSAAILAGLRESLNEVKRDPVLRQAALVASPARPGRWLAVAQRRLRGRADQPRHRQHRRGPPRPGRGQPARRRWRSPPTSGWPAGGAWRAARRGCSPGTPAPPAS